MKKDVTKRATNESGLKLITDHCLLITVLILACAGWAHGAGPVGKFAAQADAEWKKVVGEVDGKPKEYRKNTIRLREFLMVYEDQEPAREAEEKLKEVDRAWKEEGDQAFEQVKKDLDAGIATNDYSALARLESFPDGMKHPDVAKRVEEEKERHAEGVKAAFAAAREKAEAGAAAGRGEEALRLICGFEKLLIGGVGAEARALAARISKGRMDEASDAYEPVGQRVAKLVAGRQYDAAWEAIQKHIEEQRLSELPTGVRRDREMTERLRTVWTAYEKTVAGLKPGENLALQDVCGGPAYTGTVESVKGWTVALRTGETGQERLREFDMRVIPATEVVRLTKERMMPEAAGAALGGFAAMLTVDDITHPEESIAMAREYVEAAKKAGEAVGAYQTALDEKAKDPTDATAEYMLRSARVLCGAKRREACLARCIALKAKFAATVAVRENMEEVDRMMREVTGVEGRGSRGE